RESPTIFSRHFVRTSEGHVKRQTRRTSAIGQSYVNNGGVLGRHGPLDHRRDRLLPLVEARSRLADPIGASLRIGFSRLHFLPFLEGPLGLLYGLVVALYVFICFFLILVVLVQQGKGADIAGAFGGGGTQTAFGARGATTLLHKLTTGAFIGFIVIALA